MPPMASTGERSLTREQVERIARIMGRHSASAKALREADEYDGPVAFWQVRHPSAGDYIVVERLER